MPSSERYQMVRDVLVLGLLFAAMFVLFRIVCGTPLIKRVRDSVVETFASGGSFIPTTPLCPIGSTYYMYEGTAFCCSGKTNVDADQLRGTCTPAWTRDLSGSVPSSVFCTLGPAITAGGDTVPNCYSTRTNQMNAEGKAVCPPSMLNFVQGMNGDPGHCCAGPGNSDRTECGAGAGAGAGSQCAVSTSENEFVDGTSCQFLKAQQTAAPCPVGFSPYGPSPGTGATKDLSLFGCIDATKVCLHTSTMSRLQQLGYDTTGFVDCGTLG